MPRSSAEHLLTTSGHGGARFLAATAKCDHNEGLVASKRRDYVPEESPQSTLARGCVGLLKDGEVDAVTDVFEVILSPTELLQAFSNLAVVHLWFVEVGGAVRSAHGAVRHGQTHFFLHMSATVVCRTNRWRKSTKHPAIPCGLP